MIDVDAEFDKFQKLLQGTENLGNFVMKRDNMGRKHLKNPRHLKNENHWVKKANSGPTILFKRGLKPKSSFLVHS